MGCTTSTTGDVNMFWRHVTTRTLHNILSGLKKKRSTNIERNVTAYLLGGELRARIDHPQVLPRPCEAGTVASRSRGQVPALPGTHQ